MRELQFRKKDVSVKGRGQEPGWTRRLPCIAVQGYLLWGMNLLMCQTVFAADIFDIAKDAMQKVYSDVAGLATVGAVVCAAICLFLMNFSKSGKTVDESRAWLKRIVLGCPDDIGGHCHIHGVDYPTAVIYAVRDGPTVSYRRK